VGHAAGGVLAIAFRSVRSDQTLQASPGCEITISFSRKDWKEAAKAGGPLAVWRNAGAGSFCTLTPTSWSGPALVSGPASSYLLYIDVQGEALPRDVMLKPVLTWMKRTKP